ncbi:ABC transporter ATP-binding protein [Hippea jasoniae]|uniref:ABC transporter ATP-binding protein n=1 Tax=Hippea jasoniae TaxID=944479 RepID=UPI0005520033|nr:ABC transporter ATP-binding protein [Hippea jasoniae]
MLKVKDLNVFYGVIHAVKGISFNVPEGKIVTVIGANGAGKSSTLNAIAGLVKPKGSIVFAGNEIAGRPAHKIAQMGVALVPEGRRVFINLTILENLRMGGFNKKLSELEPLYEKMFELFPILKERAYQKAGTLSGGEQQMLAIARALMSEPMLLMLDEPSLGLAPKIVSEVFEILKELNRQGKTILLVEQNAAQALKLADYGYVLENGKISLEGDAKELLENEDVKKSYLGEL